MKATPNPLRRALALTSCLFVASCADSGDTPTRVGARDGGQQDQDGGQQDQDGGQQDQDGSQQDQLRPGEQMPGDGASDFVSDLRNGDGDSSREDVDLAFAGAGEDANNAEAATAPTPDSAQRAITEADIIQLDGDTLFALSRHTGLTLVDMTNPADLRVLGHHASDANPFEMYREGNVAVILENDWSRYVYDEEASATRWVSSSQVEIVDTTNRSDVRVRGTFDVPGHISDSRKVGNVLYLVTTENGYCWRCTLEANVTVTSFDLSDPQNVLQIDQLRFDQPSDRYIGNRSIAVTRERIYMAGWTWDSSWTRSGEIQVVDIADPAGDLKPGALVQIAGQISNRWQMDEYQGVLRVISQPGGWGNNAPPVVETFRVASATEVAKLGSTTMVLPRPENLRSVRFDGDRAYAITFEQTDPLFTIDLSDPAVPRQAGELEIDGWVYHMEPRGDRVFGIGFDRTVDGGSLHLSLFDVSDLANPTMLERVNFGGDWGNFAEDQDRIHKSFQLLEDEGLALIPYSGWDYDAADSCRHRYSSGIQLIDFTQDMLTLRGVAPQIGQARRAFIHRSHLFGISDNSVQTFDITLRDQPRRIDTLEVARNISTVRVLDDGRIMRFGNDWWTNRTILDVTSPEHADRPHPDAELDLTDLAATPTCERHASWGAAYVHGSVAYVSRYVYGRWESGSYETRMSFVVVDLAGEVPTVVGSFDVSPTVEQDYIGGVVLTDSALLVGRRRYISSTDPGVRWRTLFSYDIYSLADPRNPTFTTTFELPESMNHGWGMPVYGCMLDMPWGWYGWGYFGYYGMQEQALVSGDVVASQHFEALDEEDDRGRFFLDRLDVSDPASPRLLAPVNIPGQLIHYDDDAQRVTTLSYRLEPNGVDRSSCYDGRPNRFYSWQGDTCVDRYRTLNVLKISGDQAVRIGQLALDEGWYAARIAVSTKRLFLQEHELVIQPDNGRYVMGPQRVRALAATDAGLFLVHTFASDTDQASPYWGGNLVARGYRAFSSRQGELIVYDAGTPTTAEQSTHRLNSWGCYNLEVNGTDVYCALGQRGVAHVSLAKAVDPL